MTDANALLEQADALLDQNRVPEAKQLYTEVTRVDPDNADGWLMLGLIEQEQANAASAEAHLRRAIELDPDYAMAHLNLANLLRGQGRLDDARRHARRAAEADADYLEAWILLGVVELAGSRFTLAEAAFQRALSLAPDNADLHANLARCQAANGKAQDAETSLGRAISLGAASADNLLARARVQLQLEHFADAAASAQAALAAEPGRTDARLLLANALIADGRAAEARPILEALANSPAAAADVYFSCGGACHALGEIAQARGWYEKACRARPDTPRYLASLANAESQLGHYDRVVEHCRRALALQPQFAEAEILLANALAMTAAFPEAISLYRGLLQREPGNVQAIGGLLDIHEKNGDAEACGEILASLPPEIPARVPRIGLAVAKTHAQQKRHDEALALLESLLAGIESGRMEAAPNVRMGLHNQMGKLLDKKGRYADAFARFKAANSVHRCTFDAAEHAAEVDRILENWSAPDFAAAPVCAPVSRQPLFIVGMPRSGTTLVEQILSSHPLVTGGGELAAIPQVAEQMSGIHGGLPFASPACRHLVLPQLEAAARLYTNHLRGIDADARHVTDKNTYNYPHVGLIALMFPDAKIVHTRRTPLDTILSIYFQMFHGPRGFATDLDAIGAVYVQYQRLMAHWQALLPGRIFNFSYEALVDDQEGTTRALLEFCGLPWDERCLDFHANERTAMTASYNQVRQPLYRSSIDRWRHYEAELEANSGLLGLFAA